MVPQNKYQINFLLSRILMAASAKVSPAFMMRAAWCALTIYGIVNKTPCSAHLVKFLLWIGFQLRFISYINEWGGISIVVYRKTQSVSLPYIPWYGLDPNYNFHIIKGKIKYIEYRFAGGKSVCPIFILTKSVNSLKYGLSNSVCKRFFQLSLFLHPYYFIYMYQWLFKLFHAYTNTLHQTSNIYKWFSLNRSWFLCSI